MQDQNANEDFIRQTLTFLHECSPVNQYSQLVREDLLLSAMEGANAKTRSVIFEKLNELQLSNQQLREILLDTSKIRRSTSVIQLIEYMKNKGVIEKIDATTWRAYLLEQAINSDNIAAIFESVKKQAKHRFAEIVCNQTFIQQLIVQGRYPIIEYLFKHQAELGIGDILNKFLSQKLHTQPFVAKRSGLENAITHQSSEISNFLLEQYTECIKQERNAQKDGTYLSPAAFRKIKASAIAAAQSQEYDTLIELFKLCLPTTRNNGEKLYKLLQHLQRKGELLKALDGAIFITDHTTGNCSSASVLTNLRQLCASCDNQWRILTLLGRSYQHAAKESNRPEVQALLESIEQHKTILANLNKLDRAGKSCFTHAICDNGPNKNNQKSPKLLELLTQFEQLDQAQRLAILKKNDKLLSLAIKHQSPHLAQLLTLYSNLGRDGLQLLHGKLRGSWYMPDLLTQAVRCQNLDAATTLLEQAYPAEILAKVMRKRGNRIMTAIQKMPNNSDSNDWNGLISKIIERLKQQQPADQTLINKIEPYATTARDSSVTPEASATRYNLLRPS